MATTDGALMCCVICGDKNLSSKCPRDKDVSVENLNQVIQQLGVQYNPTEVSLCDGCYSGVVKAEERRAKAVEVEEDVLGLQLIILKMMRRLESLQEKYLEEIKVLQQKIRKPEEVPVGGNGEEISIDALASVKQEILDEDLGGFEDAVTAGNDASAPPQEGRNHLPSAMEADAKVLELPTIKEEINPTDFVRVSFLPAEETGAPEPVSAVKSLPVVESEDYDYVGMSKLETFNKAEDVRAVPSQPKNDTIFACDLCPKTFVSKLRLRKHKLNCHRPKTTNHCPHCDYTTNQKSNLTRHIRLKHDKTRIFLCTVCHQKFSQSTNMHRHQAFHHNICSVKKCGKVCANRQNVRDHQIKVHGKEVDVFQCPECDMLFRRKSSLSDHVKTKHRKGRDAVYSCSQCDMVYLTRKQLTNHVYSAHKKNRQRSSGEEGLILGI